MRLRQLAFAVRDLETAIADVERVLGLSLAFRDPAVDVFGLENAVFPLGDEDFLELVSPVRPDASAARYLTRRGGDTGYMVIVECADAFALEERVEKLGVRVVHRIDHQGYRSLHLHPSDCGGVLLSLDSADEWIPAGPDWRDHVRTGRVQGYAGVQIACEAPGATADLWAALLDRPERHRSLQLENAALGFVAADAERGPGIESVALRTTAAAAIREAAEERGRLKAGMVELAGTRIDFAG